MERAETVAAFRHFYFKQLTIAADQNYLRNSD